MKREFWQERWDAGQIGFHEGRPNALLAAHVDRLGAPGRVLVPLCGKAEDLAMLAARGFEVTGVEIVPQAIAQFFAEHPDLGAPRRTTALASPATTAGRITIAEADIFVVRPTDPFDAVYDRAALVALAPDTRARYVDMLAASLRPGGKMLLVTFLYDQSLVDGPPFAVSDADVTTLFSSRFSIEKCEERAATGGPKFANVPLREALFVLTRA